MLDFGKVVLVIFIVIRVLIAAGLCYLIVVEARRFRKPRVKRKKDREATEDANGKGADDSYGSRG